MRSLHSYGILALFVLICLIVGGSGGAVPPGEWYRNLAKPMLNPPAWVFGPVWTLLYVMMGVSAWLVWLHPGLPATRRALFLFALQLTLNSAWSWLFFGLHRIDLALMDILLLWAAIAATLTAFWRIRRLAAGLLVPYLLWVTFAVYLNTALWLLNP